MFLKQLRIYYVFLFFFVILSSSYAICLDSPTYIKVVSGSNDVGNFDSTFLNSAQLIYVKGNLDEYPLKVDFYFTGIENDCFASVDDVAMRLFPSGILISADSISQSGNSTIASFTFDIATTAPSSFNSNYIVKTKNNAVGTEDIIKFGVDDDRPVFTTFSVSPVTHLVLTNTTVRFQYTLSEPKVGLEMFRITGGNSNVIVNFDGNNSYSGSITETLTTTRNYVFYTKDKLSNIATINYSYIVDSQAPVLSDLTIESYTRNDVGVRKVTFSVEVDDISYTVDNSTPKVYGNFTSIKNIQNKISTILLDLR